MSSNNTHAAALADKIGSMRFAMFTTRDQNGHLISQPMTRQQVDAEGALWFYTGTTTELWDNIAHEPEVNISFANSDDSNYVSVSGTAERVVDRVKIRALWNPMVQAWFPAGPEDEHVVLVRVLPHAAEYWDANDSKMVRMFAMAKAAVTGSTPDMDADHGTIRM
ncbi:pyridoxamine 5'-phosphate oxidase family protein [Telluria aromaticivorans]|uniref:Pyridoxamine 5'-phosphate oxidase family protein n=1 Tax=Telluria aromaticivorans TaxID=2725995 RepID=A0A7Y2NZ59_9BURK|nr:pyridoxamine 5'-phosphate oxidase family protein [Telluria aromaticivorans]NNG21479.1 pyridoxamine 5'-phosphate oxidase family protein [Telluria aromaticivorans]